MNDPMNKKVVNLASHWTGEEKSMFQAAATGARIRFRCTRPNSSGFFHFRDKELLTVWERAATVSSQLYTMDRVIPFQGEVSLHNIWETYPNFIRSMSRGEKCV